MRFVALVQSNLRGHVVIPALTCVLLLFFVVGLLAPKFTVTVFALAPGSTIMYHFYLWNVVTGGLVEVSLLRFAAKIVLVLRLGGAVEKLWDFQRLAMFVGVTHAATGVICFLLNLARAMLSASSDKSSHHLFIAQHYGIGGFVSALAVAYALEWPQTTRADLLAACPRPIAKALLQRVAHPPGRGRCHPSAVSAGCRAVWSCRQ